jgi:hypothetical protein
MSYIGHILSYLHCNFHSAKSAIDSEYIQANTFCVRIEKDKNYQVHQIQSPHPHRKYFREFLNV